MLPETCHLDLAQNRVQIIEAGRLDHQLRLQLVFQPTQEL